MFERAARVFARPIPGSGDQQDKRPALPFGGSAGLSVLNREVRPALPVMRHHDGEHAHGGFWIVGSLGAVAEVGVCFIQILCGCSRFRKDIFDDLLRDIGTVRVSGL